VDNLAPHVQSVSVEFNAKPKRKRGKLSPAVTAPSSEPSNLELAS
jgi:hypothetical protein